MSKKEEREEKNRGHLDAVEKIKHLYDKSMKSFNGYVYPDGEKELTPHDWLDAKINQINEMRDAIRSAEYTDREMYMGMWLCNMHHIIDDLGQFRHSLPMAYYNWMFGVLNSSFLDNEVPYELKMRDPF